MKQDIAISVRNLTRTYQTKEGIMNAKKKKVEALRGISFDIEQGEIFGLLGPNGAGKTTTIKILTTLLAPTDGEAKVLGFDAFGEEKYIRPRINFIFGGERSLYWRLSGEDNLKYFADLYKIERKRQPQILERVLEEMGLTDYKKRKVETYSKGMKQKLQIARCLLNNPDIIFLDEPSIGLDPVAARALKAMIKNFSSQGKTVVLTTHYMQEAEELCNRIAIIDQGEIKALDTVQGLKGKFNMEDQNLEEVYVELIKRSGVVEGK